MAGTVLPGEGFSVSFSNREVTAWGGLARFKQMLDSLAFREAAAGWGLPEPKSNRGYTPLQLIEQFIVAIWCCASRFAQAETVRMDSTLVQALREAGHDIEVLDQAFSDTMGHAVPWSVTPMGASRARPIRAVTARLPGSERKPM
jgi:hypothetical protein